MLDALLLHASLLPHLHLRRFCGIPTGVSKSGEMECVEPGRAFHCRMGGIMIDSGSTFSYLISAEYRVFVQAFHAALEESLHRAKRTIPAVTRLRVEIVETWNVAT